MTTNRNPHPATVLRRAIERALRQVRVALPGVVESYDAATCTATIQVQLVEPDLLEDGSATTVRLPPVNNVPVYFQGGGGGRLTFPVQRGDTGVLLFASSSVDRWLALGGIVDPKDRRHHHIADGVAFLCGVKPRPNTAAAQASAVSLEGTDVRVGDPTTAAQLALKSDLAALKTAITNTVVVGLDGGASFKATLLAALTTWPVGTVNTKAS